MTHRHWPSLLALPVAVILLTLPITVPARAAFPGTAGRIVFVQDDSVIKTMTPAGTDIIALTTAAQSPYGDASPAWSPGGTMIAFVRLNASGNGDIWVMNANGSSQRRLTATAMDDRDPQWSPDGSRVVFSSNRSGDFEIYTMDPAGGSLKQLTTNDVDDLDPAWSPDGTRIAYARETYFEFENSGECYQDILLMDADGSNRSILLDCRFWVPADSVNCPWYLTDPEWSSNGEHLAVTESCWGAPIVWYFPGNTYGFYDPLSRYGYFSSAYEPSSLGSLSLTSVSQVGDTIDGDTDLQIGQLGSVFGTTIALAGRQSEPDWQPIPAFPLVDARFSSFEADIEWAYGAGITTGCSAERYCVNDPVTRGQMATFLARALNLPEAQFDYFDDDDGTTHEENTNRIFEAGITTGCGPGAYCPDGLVTREQMASFLARAFDLPATATDYFSDDETSSHEANINRIRAAGITTGCSATTYCPKGLVTRGQMAAFLHRAVD